MSRAARSFATSVLALLCGVRAAGAGSPGGAYAPPAPPAIPAPPACPDGVDQPWPCAEDHLVEGNRKVAVPAALRTRIEDKDPQWGAWAMVNFCVAANGAVDGARLERTSGYRALDRIALAAVDRWLFRPWSDADGHAYRVCTRMPVGYWKDSSLISPDALEAARIAGRRTVRPPARVARAIASAHKQTFGVIRLCLDQKGAPNGVFFLRSTSDAEYDRRIERAVNAWRFRPFGRPVCTAVNFPSPR